MVGRLFVICFILMLTASSLFAASDGLEKYCPTFKVKRTVWRENPLKFQGEDLKVVYDEYNNRCKIFRNGKELLNCGMIGVEAGKDLLKCGTYTFTPTKFERFLHSDVALGSIIKHYGVNLCGLLRQNQKDFNKGVQVKFGGFKSFLIIRAFQDNECRPVDPAGNSIVPKPGRCNGLYVKDGYLECNQGNGIYKIETKVSVKEFLKDLFGKESFTPAEIYSKRYVIYPKFKLEPDEIYPTREEIEKYRLWGDYSRDNEYFDEFMKNLLERGYVSTNSFKREDDSSGAAAAR